MLEKFKRKVFDDSCTLWTSDRQYNTMIVNHNQNYANNLLQCNRWISLNDVLKLFGFSLTLEGQIIGWKIDDKLDRTNCVIFDILEDDGPNITIEFKNLVKLL